MRLNTVLSTSCLHQLLSFRCRSHSHRLESITNPYKLLTWEFRSLKLMHCSQWTVYHFSIKSSNNNNNTAIKKQSTFLVQVPDVQDNFAINLFLFFFNRLTNLLSGHKIQKFSGLRRREFSCQSTGHTSYMLATFQEWGKEIWGRASVETGFQWQIRAHTGSSRETYV